MHSLTCAVLIVLSPLTVPVQSLGGTIIGKLSDVTGGAVAGAPVQAKNTSTETVQKAQSNAAGVYSFAPLPAGSYPIQDVDAAAPPPTLPPSDTHRGLLAVRSSVTDFSAFIATEWASRGWTMGKGDAERGEAEGGYRRGDFGGAYRVRDVYCDPTFSELLLVYGPGATTESS